MAEEGTPKLVLTNVAPSYKVGSEIKVELHNFILGESGEIPNLQTNPTGLEIVEKSDSLCYTLVPLKYGVFRITVEGQTNCQLVIHVTPLEDLVLPRDRVSGDTPLQLPRDILVTKDGGFIVADGIRMNVLKMDKEGKNQSKFDLPQNVDPSKFSPFSLALKQDEESEENNEVYVTDIKHACVHVYHGTRYLESFGKNHLKRPTGIAVDGDGCVFVADHHVKRVFQFTADYRLVEDEAPYELLGPQLMRIHKPTDTPDAPAALYVADRSGSRICMFFLLPAGTNKAEETNHRSKTLQWVGNIEINAEGLPPGPILPFCMLCDPDGHIFISGQVKVSDRDSRGYIWFRAGNSSNFGGCEATDWSFGHGKYGLRNPGGMRIVDDPDGRRYLYVTDMRGKNANNCINRYTLRNSFRISDSIRR